MRSTTLSISRPSSGTWKTTSSRSSRWPTCGRTLNHTFVILDEGQNTTVTQMKMFLTRMGNDSRIVVTGDTTQIDLPPHMPSGLIDAMQRLGHIEGVEVVELTGHDIVRHRLVREIVDAYDSEVPHRKTEIAAARLKPLLTLAQDGTIRF